MKTTEIRKMTMEDIINNISLHRNEIAELRRRIHMGETTNIRVLRTKRKDLARMLTIMSENLAKETI